MQKIIDEVFDELDYFEMPELANALIKVLEGLPTASYMDMSCMGTEKAVLESDIQSTIEMIRKKVN